MPHRSNAPYEDGDEIADLRPDAVDKAPRNEKADGIRCRKSGDDVAVLDFVPADILL